MAENLFQENSGYRVTARKWRPKNFKEVTSQEFITKTLKNAIKNNRISHAYLFSGPRGVGKTTVARILAKSLNCLNPKPDGTHCDVCESCKEINNDNRNHPDVFEIDGASNRNIEDVRELKEKVKYGPIRSKYKIFIIDEVHMLTGASFNALLKTLEEPPPYVVFIFATTSPEKVPLTILGRCQKFDFKRHTIEEIKARIKFIADNEKIKIDDESLFFIAKKGDGSMRDAQGLFDMSASFCDNAITFDKLKSFFNLAESDVYFTITDLIKTKDGNGLLNYFNELMNKGYDMQSFLDGLTEHFRNLLVASSTNSVDLIVESDSVKSKYSEFIGKFSEIEIINSLKLILQTEYTFKYSSNQRTLIEALLIELIKFTDTKDISQIMEELQQIKSGSGRSTYKPASEIKQASESVSSSANIKAHTPIQNSVQSSANDKTAGNYKTAEPTKPASGTDNIPKEIITIDMTEANKELDVHWNYIKDTIRNERKWVYSIIKDSSFDIDDKNKYRIKIDESMFELLDSYKDYLCGKISAYFGQTITVNLVKYSDEPAVSQNISNSPEKHDKNNTGKENYDKLRSILINEFNAREVS